MQNDNWIWNEIQQVGTDYTNIEEVAKYDERMGTVRNVEAENNAILETLKLTNASILEIGCGTGRFTLAAAKAGNTLSAIDVSAMMLTYVQAKAKKQGLSAITTQHAGFLSMDFAPETFDAVVSGLALHHLPDVWKQMAVDNIYRTLKTAGQFILKDIVYDTTVTSAKHNMQEFIDCFASSMGKEVIRHVQTEYSTTDWIMEGILTRAGFEIVDINTDNAAIKLYHCKKN